MVVNAVVTPTASQNRLIASGVKPRRLMAGKENKRGSSQSRTIPEPSQKTNNALLYNY